MHISHVIERFGQQRVSAEDDLTRVAIRDLMEVNVVKKKWNAVDDVKGSLQLRRNDPMCHDQSQEEHAIPEDPMLYHLETPILDLEA